MDNTQQLYNTTQVAAILGVTYHRVWYAVIRGHVTPWSAGSARLFDETHIEALREHFAVKNSK